MTKLQKVHYLIDTKLVLKVNAIFNIFIRCSSNLVPRAFSSTIFKMADRREKTLAHSRNHVTDLSTEGGNLFKMAAKIRSERIWVRGLETGEKQTKWWQTQTRMAQSDARLNKEAKSKKECMLKQKENSKMI